MNPKNVVVSVKRFAKIAALSIACVAGVAVAQDGWTPECLWPGSWDQAYVPCISAIDYGNGRVDPGWTGGNTSSGTENKCYAFNRDGKTCGSVGYSEGQVGTPWGQGNGQFRCADGCLQYIGR